MNWTSPDASLFRWVGSFGRRDKFFFIWTACPCYLIRLRKPHNLFQIENFRGCPLYAQSQFSKLSWLLIECVCHLRFRRSFLRQKRNAWSEVSASAQLFLCLTGERKEGRKNMLSCVRLFINAHALSCDLFLFAVITYIYLLTFLRMDSFFISNKKSNSM